MKQASRQLPLPFHKTVEGGFRGLLLENPGSVSIAVRPMARLYTYQAFALANALAYLRQNPEARLRVDLADLEFDMQRGLGFLPYSRDPACIENSESIKSMLAGTSAIDPSLPGRISVRRLSSWLSEDPGLMEHVSALFRGENSREAKRIITNKTGRASKIPASPICPSCGHSSASFGTISADGLLKSTCHNKECGGFGKPFSVSVHEPGSFCLFYFFDSLADGYHDPRFGRTDLHMIGIDAQRRWGNGIGVSEVISRLTALFTPDGYSPRQYPLMRLEDPNSFSRKSVFSVFLEQRNITAIGALDYFIALAREFDGTHHIAMADLNAFMPRFGRPPSSP